MESGELEVLCTEESAYKPTNILLKMFLLSYKDMHHFENALPRDWKSFQFRANQVACLLHFNSFQVHLFHTALILSVSFLLEQAGFGNGFNLSLPAPCNLNTIP